MSSEGISIIIPVYNEKDAIKDTLSQFRHVKDKADFELEIIIVNDGSNDGTEEILNNIREERPWQKNPHPAVRAAKRQPSARTIN